MDVATALLYLGSVFLTYKYIYYKNKLMGNITFIVLSLGIMLIQANNYDILISVIMTLLAMTNTIIDLLQ